MGLEPDDTVDLIRKEFEDQFGRPLSQTEWSTLEAHAQRNYREVMKSGMSKYLPET